VKRYLFLFIFIASNKFFLLLELRVLKFKNHAYFQKYFD